MHSLLILPFPQKGTPGVRGFSGLPMENDHLEQFSHTLSDFVAMGLRHDVSGSVLKSGPTVQPRRDGLAAAAVWR